ncbi:MAG: YitT family protein [Clostridia bacterium]|jgi:uncharacterized membrane-anchored protein YitT (DUF2179 family)|nr:YitT family protein [Clostridia bacterium]
MTKSKFQNILLDILAELFGSFCVAISFYNFTTVHNIPMSGFSGIGLIFNRLFGLPVGMVVLALNIPMALLCLRILGFPFVAKSLRCMLFQTFMFDVVAVRLPLYEGEPLLAVACSGAIAGVGLAVIFMRGSSTGGSDFIAMAVKAFNQHIPVGRIIMVLDFVIVIVGGLLFKNFDGIIYGALINIIYSMVIDKILYGINAGKLAIIVTNFPNEIAEAIAKNCDRGATLIRSIGAYRGEERWTVLCACSTKEMIMVEKAAKEVDPTAFTIILESSEVLGEGFHMTRVAEKQS